MTYSLQNKSLAGTTALAAGMAVHKENKAKIIKPANAGDMPFINTDAARSCNYFPMVINGEFCLTAAEVTAARDRVVSFKDVFDSWKRFSHRAATVPPAVPAELDSWNYDTAADAVVSSINSSSHIGIVSRDKYDNYELEVYLSSSGGDDDTVGIVIGFVTDAAGVERSLIVTRSPGGNANQVWSYAYNFVNNRAGLTVQYIDTSKLDKVKWGSGNTGANAAAAGYTPNQNGGWNGMKRCKVHIVRQGDIITCRTSDFEFFDPTMAYIESATLTINLNDHAEGAHFKAPCAYGYSCYSQDRAKWSVIKFTGGTRVIYDITNKQVLVNTGTGWSVSSRSIVGDYGTGKLLFNRFTGKFFYLENANEIYHLNKNAF